VRDHGVTIARGCPTQAGLLVWEAFPPQTTQQGAADPNENSQEEAMPTKHRSLLRRLSLTKILCLLVVLWVAIVMASSVHAQTLVTTVDFDNANGYTPMSSLVQYTNGNFYGTTARGGANSNRGTVFTVAPNGTLTTLYNFCSQPNCSDGSLPATGLVFAGDGNFYGTTWRGGSSQACLGGCGTVFKITPSGTFTSLYSFCSQQNCADGQQPLGGLVQGSDGNLYGTTWEGGVVNSGCSNGCGTVFKISLTGTLTTLHSFQGADGALPTGVLMQATDGNFYGTTSQGGALQNCTGGCGTVFQITPGGALSTKYSFCSQQGCSDGTIPHAGLLQASDGNLYGTTQFGGISNSSCSAGCGTVFKITLSGTLSTIYSFCAQSGCTDGSAPAAGLIQLSDGNLYSTTSEGGVLDCSGTYCGTLFKLTPSGALTTLHAFIGSPSEGSDPLAGLVLGVDGNLYGTTMLGGASNAGTVFRLTGPNPVPLQFVPVTPCRVADTRQANGEFGGPPIPGNSSRSFSIPQNTTCNIPGRAAAYSLNVTVVPITTLGYLTIWPTGESQPVVSTMNSPDGRVKANAAIVPAGGNGGAVSVYASNTTDVILDIDGYFTASGSGTYQFYPLTPCRIVDTRGGDGGMLQAGVESDYTIAGNCGVPSNAAAYSFNVTVLPAAGGLDYLTVWPKGETQPGVSTLNDNTGTIVANAAIVPAGTENATAFYAHSNSTNLLVDVDGYFAPTGTGGLSLYPVAPCRVLDTRQNHGQPFSGEKTVNVVGSACAPPSNAAAYIFNATVVPPGPMLFLSLWPDGETQPTVSTLNAKDGFITSNMAIVPTTNGSIDAYAAALTQLILDISGYFAP